ncbi:tetratricopeptide repeat protein [Hydrogenobaculum acidophilum]
MKVYKIVFLLAIYIGISYAGAEQCINLFQSKNYKKAIELAKSSLKWNKYDFNYNMCAAMSYLSLGEPKNAISYLKNAKKNANTRYQQEALYNYLGVSYDMMGNKAKALENYTKAYKLAKSLGDSKGIVDNLSNIAHIFYSEGYYDSAINFYKKALKQDSNSPTILNNIALCYEDLNHPHKALQYYARSSQAFNEKGDKVHEGATYLNMGVLYLKLLDFKDAKQCIQKGLGLVNGNKYWEAVGYQYMGWYYDNKDKRDKAILYYQKALTLANQIGAEGLAKSIQKNISSEEIANEY